MGLAAVLPGDGVDRRRLTVLLVLLLLVLLGLGIGLAPGGDGPSASSPQLVSADSETATTTTTVAGGGDTEETTPGGPGSPTDDGTRTPDGDATTTQESTTARPTDDDSDVDDGGDGGAGGGGGGGGGSDDGGDAGDDAGRVNLETVGSDVVVRYQNVVPGDTGRERVVLRNEGNASGRLYGSSLAVRGSENGIGPAEAGVDDSPGAGELSGHVMVVLEVHNPDGSVDSLYGTGDGPRSLAELGGVGGSSAAGVLEPGEDAEIVFDWYVPTETGNEIQSDSVAFDVSFVLEQTD